MKRIDNLFGDMFDLNGDGKTTLDEEYIAYNVFEECQKDMDDSGDDDFDEDE